MELRLDDAVVVYEYTDAGDGQPPLLFLHGALGTRRQFDALRKRFPERSQIAVDFPSHGESTATPDEINTERFARDVLALLDELKIEQVDVVGYSMGGYVGIAMSFQAPHRVRSIVSHAMKFYWTDEAISGTLRDLDGDLIRERSQRGYDALSQMHAASGLERTLSQTRSLISDFLRWQLTPEMMREVPAPLLISVGDRDDLVPVAEAVRLFGELDPKRSGLAVLPNTPHPFHHVSLDCFEHNMRRFWAAVMKAVAA
jgi:pimeloyl-ACP methyl ester carboxylesterase